MGGMGAPGRNFHHDLISRYGWAAEAGTIQELYLSGHKQEAAAAAPAELLELTSLIGPAPYVRDRIAAFAESGVTVLNVTPVGDDPRRQLALVKEMMS